MKIEHLQFTQSPRQDRLLLGLAVGGGAALSLGLLLDTSAALASLLTAGYWLTCTCLFGLLFVAIQYASGASWAVAFRRVPESMTAALPVGLGLTGLALVLGLGLYPWVHEHDHFTGFKGAWLSVPFFLVRAGLYVALWLFFARVVLHGSRRQGEHSTPERSEQVIRHSVIFLVVFAITFWLASFDWIMSLEPHWYSTIFGIYNFAGLFSAGLATMIVLLVWLRKNSPLRSFVNEEHLHDLGKLLFGFCTFWMYIWFSQYMLIWYANMTEETVYYIKRQQQYWGPLFVLNVVLNWIIPFFALLSKRVKRTGHLLARVAGVVLVGRWLDLYLMVQPATGAPAPRLALWDAGAILLVSAVFVFCFLRTLRSAEVAPLGDPRLAESLHYHN